MKKNIIFGISGSIAGCKSLDLALMLKKAGFNLRIIFSKSGSHFASVTEFEKHFPGKVYTHNSENPLEQKKILHIELAKFAEYILIAPTSANIIAKLAGGFGDCLLSTTCLASQAKIIMAPAMNKQMWANNIVQHNLNFLQDMGHMIIDPATGEQACGDFGKGRMQEPDAICEFMKSLYVEKILSGKKIIITSGPTIEKIDPVRFISNFSSGKMGKALAEEAANFGGQVILISHEDYGLSDNSIRHVQASTAEEMLSASLKEAQDADIFIGAAAIADYRPNSYSDIKIKKNSKQMSVSLTKNPDVISEVKATYPDLFCVGFAAETNDHEANGKAKLIKKNLDMLAINDVAGGKVFGSDYNQVTLLTKTDVKLIKKSSKNNIAKSLLEFIYI